MTAWLGWRAVLAIPVIALPLLLAVLPDRRALTRNGYSSAERLDIVGAAALAAAGLWWRVRRTPDGFVPRRVVTARGFLPAGLIGGTVFAGYYGVLFIAPSLIKQATDGGALQAGVFLVPAGWLAGTLAGRFSGWQVSGGLAALPLTGLVLSLTRRPGAGIRQRRDRKGARHGPRALQGRHH